VNVVPIKESKPGTARFLRELGVPELSARTHPFDPGYDPHTVISHLEQSAHLMASLKISMACWLVGDEESYRSKIAFARRQGVITVTGGGPFEIAVALGKLDAYLSLCADMGIERIEAGQGFTDMPLAPRTVIAMARARGLDVQVELGKKHGGAFTTRVAERLVDQGARWLDAGAVQVVVAAGESARGVGLFDDAGRFDARLADRFADSFGFEVCVFEAPTKPSQFALLRHFGDQVALSNVRLEELLRVEIYRRALHADAFAKPRLRFAAVEEEEPR